VLGLGRDRKKSFTAKNLTQELVSRLGGGGGGGTPAGAGGGKPGAAPAAPVVGGLSNLSPGGLGLGGSVVGGGRLTALKTGATSLSLDGSGSGAGGGHHNVVALPPTMSLKPATAADALLSGGSALKGGAGARGGMVMAKALLPGTRAWLCVCFGSPDGRLRDSRNGWLTGFIQYSNCF
jgi:hypothetical protein